MAIRPDMAEAEAMGDAADSLEAAAATQEPEAVAAAAAAAIVEAHDQ
jgi:hypothetical protein